jgi:hypothetical protein
MVNAKLKKRRVFLRPTMNSAESYPKTFFEIDRKKLPADNNISSEG